MNPVEIFVGGLVGAFLGWLVSVIHARETERPKALGPNATTDQRVDRRHDLPAHLRHRRGRAVPARSLVLAERRGCDSRLHHGQAW